MIIGITGIIGAGKSTVSQLCRELFGAFVIDADKIGHLLLSSDLEVMSKVLAELGTNKRPELAKLVFQHPDKLKKLNKITHPAIRKKVKEIIQQNKTEKLIIIDAALLFTIRLHRFCNKVIFVEADLAIIKKRLLKRGLSEKNIQLRLRANQAVLKLKDRCTHIIENNVRIEELKAQFKKNSLLLKH